MKTFTGSLFGDLVTLSEAVVSHNYPREFTRPEELTAYIRGRMCGTCQAGECFEPAIVSDLASSLSYCRSCWNLMEFVRKLDIQ